MDEKLFSDEIRARERRRKRWGLLWSIVSFILHCAFFVAIVLLTPVKSLVFEEKEKANPAAELSSDRLEQISESLSEARINELLNQLEELQTVLHNMDLMKEELQKDYDAFAEESAESMKEELSKLVDEAEKAQRDAEAAQPEIIEKVEKMLAEEKSDLMDENRSKWLRETSEDLMLNSGEKVADAQARAGNALDKVQMQAQFAGYDKTSKAAEKVRDAQIEASSMQNQAQTEASKIAKSMSEYRGRAQDLANNEKALKEQRERLEKAEAERKDAEKQLAEAEKRRDEAASARDAARNAERQSRDEARQAKAEKSDDRAKELTAKAEGFKREAHESEKTFNEQRSQADREKRRAESNARTAEDAKRRIADLEKRVAERKAAFESVETVRRESVNEKQVEKLKSASQAQASIRERIDILRDVLKNDTPQLSKLACEDRLENELVTRDASSMSLVDAYELAREIEGAITESYKDIRATQTAIEHRMGYEAAQKITDVAKAVRMEADREAIETRVRTKEALDAQKTAQAQVVREANVIVETAVAMMEEAMDFVKPDGGAEKAVSKGSRSKSVQWLDAKDFASRSQEGARQQRLKSMSSAADYQVAITDAAAESASARAKDLTKVGGGTGAAAGHGDGSGAVGGGAGGLQQGRTASVSPPGGGSVAAIESRMPGLLPGNVLRFGPSGDGVPAKWMYVQDWYVIGPFPNPNRVNIRRKFPPESVVDLDATYIGKGGRTVKWEFMQTCNFKPRKWEWWHSDRRAELVPYTSEEYGIWYAYAEVFSDIECDRWIAVGSDDRSDIWLNDAPIWGSSDKLKSWRIDEGYRRVHLKKGRNRILARVENGWHLIGWSICISLEEGSLAK